MDDAVFPATYPHDAIGMVWGGKGVHATWFGADPEFIHGINLLPITSGSLYLGRHPDYVLANYAEVVKERNGQPNKWKDVLWQYLALADPTLALSHYYADPGYEPFDGESRAHTLHWLFNLKKMGRVDTTIVADSPTYAVFRDSAGEITYVAYNAGSVERTVTFSDGFTLTLGPRELGSATTAVENPNAPVALLQSSATSGKVPLSVQFEANRSFDRAGGALTFAWDFGGAGTSAQADTVFTFRSQGDFLVRLTVTNSLGLTARDSVLIRVLGNGTPYSGTPAAVPGRIQAENYDRGGEGVAYHDAEANNIGLAFRPTEGVDLESSAEQGFAVYWITAGEWIEYTIAVAQAGTFDISPYVATVPGFGNFTLRIDGIDVSGKRAVLNTGGWQFWKPITVSNVPISAGTHILRFDFDSDSDKTGWLFSMNWIDVARSTSTGVETGDLPLNYELAQNYPNPFNPTSLIRYALPQASHVRLEVFDALGRRVRELVNTRMEAGTHDVLFDADGLSTGLYVYRISTPAFSKSRSMVLVR